MPPTLHISYPSVITILWHRLQQLRFEMTTYLIHVDDLASLKDKTILITGAATGIGRSAVQIALGKTLDNQSNSFRLDEEDVADV